MIWPNLYYEETLPGILEKARLIWFPKLAEDAKSSLTSLLFKYLLIWGVWGWDWLLDGCGGLVSTCSGTRFWSWISSSSTGCESNGGKLEDSELEGSNSPGEGSGKLSKASRSYSSPSEFLVFLFWEETKLF